MRYALAFSILLLAGAALADPRPTSPPHGVGTLCLDTLGTPHAAVCRTGVGSRIETDPDICVCRAGLREVKAPYCGPGERPAPDSLAANRALLGSIRGGVVSGTFEGRRFCVERGRTGY